MEVVDLNRARYSNRDALDKALHVYLEAMYSFTTKCLSEESIRDALRLPSDSNIEEKIEVKDIAYLIRAWPHWDNHFKEEFKIIERNDIRYYDARSVTGLIVEGRNQVSHQRLRELEPEFTRSQLFFIAEILGQINRPDAQREVETIRDELFDDTTDEKAKYEKSIADVEKRLAVAEETNKKLSKQIVDNAVKLNKKTEDIEKLSGRLVAAKLGERESKKQLKSTSKRLEKVQAEHRACEQRLTTISNQLASTEVERNDSEKRLSMTSKELEEAKAEWQVYKDSLSAMQNLFTASTIGNMVFPPFETDSAVRILDRQNIEKKNYLLNLLEQKQPTIIYVQSKQKIDQLRDLVGPEKAKVIGKHNEQTSETEETEILKKLENGELIAVVSNTTLATLTSSHRVEHFVFCHLVPGLDAFFERCQPAFTSANNAYLHFIYNSEQDMEGLVQKYPDREVLEKLYPELTNLAETNGNFTQIENLYSELDIAKLGIETGLAIFEELQLLERTENGIKLLPPAGKKLDESDIYRKGEKLKRESEDFQTFQRKHSIEQIWEKILEKLNVDSKQILRENITHKMPLRISETEGDYLKDSQIQPEQPTEVVEIDNREVAKSTKTKSRKKKPSIAERYIAETTVEDRDGIAAKVVELRINATGSKPLAWREIREKLGLHNDQFHKVIRPSEGYRKAVIQRIKSLKAQEDGWEYNGKLEVLTGIELTEKDLE